MTATQYDGALIQIEGDFVDALEGWPLVREESSRTMLVENIGRQLGGTLSLRMQATARMNIIELVRVCAGQPRGLELLVEQVRFADPLAPELPELRHLRDEWQAVHDLGDLWPELQATLRPLRLMASDTAELRILCELAIAATGSRMLKLPRQCSTVWRLFVHLVGANADPNSLPPCVALLDCLVDHVPDPVASKIRKARRSMAVKWELADPPDFDQESSDPPQASSAMPVQRSQAIFYALVSALEEVPCVRDPDTRVVLVGQLPSSIAGALAYSTQRRIYAINVMRACLDHEGGLADLVATIRQIEGADSVPLRRLVRLVRQLPPEFTG